jgi:prophage antirepressor-like protein
MTTYCPTVFVFNNVRVYDALHIRAKVPEYFKGCSETILRVLEKKSIPKSEYFFASCSRAGEYKECSEEYKSRRILIKANWAEQNVPGFHVVAVQSAQPTKSPAPPVKPMTGVPAPRHAPVQEVAPPAKPTKAYVMAPPILDLEESEKFTDAAGKVYNIEVRGERHYDKIWFKARDVETMLELTDITTTMTDSKSSYDQNVHYITFDLRQDHNAGISCKGINKSELGIYLSYWGLVKMLFGRRSKVAIRFQRWAIEKLFAVQLGTLEAKRELAAGVMGIPPKTLKAVLDTNAVELPVIYMFQLGTVKDLRNSFPCEIPASFKDTDIVFKYGLTKDLKTRTSQHETSFKKFRYGNGDPVNILLKHHVYVDPLHLTQAEMDIERYFKQVSKWHLLFKEDKLTEVIAVPVDVVETILKTELRKLGLAYAGRYKDLQVKSDNQDLLNKQLKLQLDNQEVLQRDMEAQFKALMQEKEKHYQEVVRNKELHYQDVLKEKDMRLQEKELRLKEKDEMMNLYRMMVQKFGTL